MARTTRPELTACIDSFTIDAALHDRASALAFFLLQSTGSIFGSWIGRITADDQRILFGRKIGKGRFRIDGDKECVEMSVSKCFGTMREIEFSSSWAAIC